MFWNDASVCHRTEERCRTWGGIVCVCEKNVLQNKIKIFSLLKILEINFLEEECIIKSNAQAVPEA